MRNQNPVPPQVYSSPPEIRTEVSTKERLVHIAHSLENLTAELLQILTSPKQELPLNLDQQQEAVQEEEEAQHRARRELTFKRKEQQQATERSGEAGKHLHQAQANLSLISTNTSSAARECRNGEVTDQQEIRSPSTTAPTPKSRNTSSSASYKKKRGPTSSNRRRAKTSNKSRHPRSSPVQTDSFQPGDTVQIIGGSNFIGSSATVIKSCNRQVCVHTGRKVIYRKKSNLKKLNF